MVIAIVLILLLALCLGFWCWAVAPGKGADFTEFHRFDYAHRGLHNKDHGVPENSEKAFALAVQGGFGMEFDLQLTRDNYVVVHHDPTLKRTCGEDRRIADLTLAELRQHHLFGTQERVPLFSDVLKIVDGRTPLIIELKGYQRAEDLCPLVMKELEGYTGLYCVESFDPRIVQWFRENRPEICRGQLMEWLQKGNEGLTGAQAFFGRHMFTNFKTRPHFEAYDFHNRGTPSLALARRLFGMQEVSWTLRKLEDFSAAKKMGNLCIFEGFVPEQDEEAAKFAFEKLTVPASAAVEGAEIQR